MYWHELLPPHIAREQIAWERRRMIRRVLTSFPIQQKEIAKTLGVSPTRIWQMAHRPHDDVAPLFKWMREPKTVPGQMKQKLRDAKTLLATLNDLFGTTPD